MNEQAVFLVALSRSNEACSLAEQLELLGEVDSNESLIQSGMQSIYEQKDRKKQPQESIANVPAELEGSPTALSGPPATSSLHVSLELLHSALNRLLSVCGPLHHAVYTVRGKLMTSLLVAGT